MVKKRLNLRGVRVKRTGSLCKMEDEIVGMYESGKGPLSIAVVTGRSAREVLTVLYRSGKLSEEYEPGCWGLSSNYI